LLDDVPELRALKTRIVPLQLIATFGEVAALMRSVALQGFVFGVDFVTPTECLTVAEYVIGRMHAMSRPLDMRLFVSGVKDYLQDKQGHAKTEWQQLIETRLMETTTLREGRAARLAREQAVALEVSELDATPAERMRIWKERTGASERAYWRRLRSLASPA
jgi:hypothetical protein